MRKTIFALGMIIGVGFSVPAQAIQCVPYARQISGVQLSGDAWRWWSAAAGVYQRGKSPQVGAILVFEKTGRMRRGHVAVVRSVVGKREIRIDHANWPSAEARRGGISLNVSVIDVSRNNDWTQVRVWYEPSNTYGARINPTHGFIYGKPGQARPQLKIQEASLRPDDDTLSGGIARPSVSISALQAPAAQTAAKSTSAQLNAQVLARLRGNGSGNSGKVLKVSAKADHKTIKQTTTD